MNGKSNKNAGIPIVADFEDRVIPLPHPSPYQHRSGVPSRSATPRAESVEEQFERLAAAWHKAVAHHSSSRIRDNHPAYQEIIGIGPAVVPLLLRDLDINRRHWFAALSAITGVDPVSEEDAGNIP